MSYKVFARKWRPLNFAQVVGQEHVVRALVNGIEHDRLHHAYLFTGTRGVGKTTIARVLAKALNCPNSAAAEPCGQCDTCLDVDQGRYPDLIEVDAASRTGVDDTRDLLENVQYLPSRGKYKVYLIDEVHMFSKSSFNALLKTLEEPPDHVKFLLATTDPQKMPVTVLSRCLQFNLKRLLPAQIEGQFKLILESEGIDYQPEAAELLARAADGSMRDGLSLLDQAIVHGNGTLNEPDVIDMLGSVAREPVVDLLAALVSKQADTVLDSIESLDEFAPNYAEVLQSLLLFLHQMAVYQLTGKESEVTVIKTLADQLSKEDVQLYYQIALIGQKDLALAPSPKVGFEMLMLRMLAFTPVETSLINRVKPQDSVQTTMRQQAVSEPATVSSNSLAVEQPIVAVKKAPKLVIPEKKNTKNLTTLANGSAVAIAPAIEGIEEKALETASAPLVAVDQALPWDRLVPALGLDPMTLQLANNAVLVRLGEEECELALVDGHVSLNKKSEQNLELALSNYYGRRLSLLITQGATDIVTPNHIAMQKVTDRQEQAELEINQNVIVKKIIELFGAEIIDGSIKPIE